MAVAHGSILFGSWFDELTASGFENSVALSLSKGDIATRTARSGRSPP